MMYINVCTYMCALCNMDVCADIEGDRQRPIEKFIRETSNILPYSKILILLEEMPSQSHSLSHFD